MPPKLKLYILLWCLGLAGEVTLLWAELPLPPEPLPLPLPVIKWVMLLQSMVILTVAVGLGVALAAQVKLSAPFLEAIAHSSVHPGRALQKQLLPGAVGGVLSAVLALGWLALLRSALPPDFLTVAETFRVPLLTRILRGGISEEILMRWGLMTLLVWLPWRVLHKRQSSPRTWHYRCAVVIAAVFFGILHLPVVALLSPKVTATLVIYVVGGNFIVGAIAGYLYWRIGFEAAMIAHVLFHVFVAIAETLG